MQITLTLTESQHRHLRELLYPGDGLESVALMLCGRRAGANRHKLVVRQIIPLPDSAYIDRAPDRVSWKTDILITLLNEAAKSQLAVVKVHSHPGGYTAFSAFDDMSDQALFPSVHGWIDDGQPHGSVILLPDGKLFGRAFELNGNIVPFDSIMVVGDDILIWNAEDISSKSVPAHAKRNVQVFGSATYDKLCRMHIAVVGCSGTGSIVIEQLARYGVGHLVIIDPKTLEDKNLNRILNSTAVDVGRPKVDVLAERIHAMGMGTTVERYACNLFNVDALKAVAGCDVVLGCMDSIDGRDLLNKIATFYLLPYIDIGVRLEADGQG